MSRSGIISNHKSELFRSRINSISCVFPAMETAAPPEAFETDAHKHFLVCASGNNKINLIFFSKPANKFCKVQGGPFLFRWFDPGAIMA